MIESQLEAAAKQTADHLVNKFLQKTEQEVASQLKRTSLKLPTELQGGLFEVDLMEYPKLNLSRHRVLNRDPSQYFGVAVDWPPPVIANIPELMGVLGLGFLSPLTDRVRLLVDGKLFVHSVSGLWFHIFGVEMILPDGKLKRLNQIRPSLERDPNMIRFLEGLQ